MRTQRNRIRSCLIFFCVFLSGAFLAHSNRAFAGRGELRFSEPLDSVIADLKEYIPARMEREGVPGLSIALIRDNRLAWAEGFGVTNRLTREPVEPNTVFEAASISKAVNAYVALRLVDRGLLSLDAPAHTYLEEPWLPRSGFSDRITLRHLLSHGSGLGDDPFFRNKSLAFEPGTGFQYSGLGAEYARALIEKAAAKPLEKAARKEIFSPLGMPNSSFVDDAGVMENMANGHMRYLLPFLAFLAPFLALLFITGAVAVSIRRVVRGRWMPGPRLKAGVFLVAFILTWALLNMIIGKQFPNLVWAALICGLVFSAFMFLSLTVSRRAVSRIGAARRGKAIRAAVTIAWIVLSLILFLTVVNSFQGPVPRNGSNEASAVGSLRATAPDLAVFLIELARPEYLNERLASEIDSVQVNINQDFSWGLGIGIQHTDYGDAIWQNAITFAFRGIMVIYPQHGWGVVVLTNSESGLPVAYDAAERALGGEAKWKFF